MTGLCSALWRRLYAYFWPIEPIEVDRFFRMHAELRNGLAESLVLTLDGWNATLFR